MRCHFCGKEIVGKPITDQHMGENFCCVKCKEDFHKVRPKNVCQYC